MLFSLSLFTVGLLSAGTPQPQPYWLTCAGSMGTTLAAAAVGHTTSAPDEYRVAAGMDHATACTNNALRLPLELRLSYQDLLTAFMAALNTKAPADLDAFFESRGQFIAAIEASTLPAIYALSDADSDRLVREAKAAVEQDLRDPMSAQYRNVRVLAGPMMTVCGEVNAKNAYGGYVGFRRFVVSDGSLILEDTAASPAIRAAEAQVISGLCSSN